MKKALSSANAPAALGPYAQAIVVGDTIYCSGQLGLNPISGELPESVEEQTTQAMKNIAAILETSNATFINVVKTTIFLADMNDFQKVNHVYSSYFEPPFPARSTVQVARLPKDAKVEIEVLARI